MKAPRSTNLATNLGEGRWRLEGALDFSTVTHLLAVGDDLFRQLGGALPSERRLEIDLSAVTSANSAGLALLLEWMEMAGARDVQLTYRHLPDALNRIAAFSNLQGLLPVAGEAV